MSRDIRMVVLLARARLAIMCCVALTLTAACGGGEEQDAVDFVFRLRGMPVSEEFRVRSSSRTFIDAARAELARPAGQREAYPIGTVKRGNGGHNGPWTWHLESVRLLAGPTTEVCDGTPSMVEEDVAYWVDRLGTFCPWLAYVHREAQ